MARAARSGGMRAQVTLARTARPILKAVFGAKAGIAFRRCTGAIGNSALAPNTAARGRRRLLGNE